MNVKIAAICDYALSDRDNKLSIIGVFDEINPPVLPFVLPSMYLVVAFEAEAVEAGTDFKVEYLFWQGDGNPIFRREAVIRFNPPARPGGVTRHNEIMGLHMIPLVAAGDYAFLVMVNGRQEARVPLRVNEVRK